MLSLYAVLLTVGTAVLAATAEKLQPLLLDHRLLEHESLAWFLLGLDSFAPQETCIRLSTETLLPAKPQHYLETKLAGGMI